VEAIMTTVTRPGGPDLPDLGAAEVVTPEHPDYDDARSVWNAMVDRRPSLVVRARSAADVAPTVEFARSHGLDLAIRGGGHNVAGNSTVDGGLVLDLSGLRAVTVDPGTRAVRVEAGATLVDVDAATAPHALAVPLGVVGGTGVAGLTLGGGVGWLTRAHGLTADNLLSAEIVTASGETLVADADRHADLLWALRGGGGNFGVVTAFTFRAHPLGPEVLGATFGYRLPSWRRAWAAVETWTRDLPDDMTAITTTLTPPADLDLGDEPVLLVGAAWASPDRARGEQLLAGLRELAPPDIEETGAVPWTEWQTAMDGLFPKGVRAYWRNTSFDRLDDEVVDVLVRRGEEQDWVGTAFDVHHMGGAFARVGADHSPFPARASRFWINIYGFWADAADDEERVAFVRGLSDDMAPFSTGGQYVNFQAKEQPGHRVVDPRAVYGDAAYERLVQVKRRYDPENLFHLNLNIPPG
jgi:FAD/FMN-containing dehydrogenase